MSEETRANSLGFSRVFERGTPVIRTPCPGVDKLSASTGEAEVSKLSEQRLAVNT
jgi:hypothetical protein